jgi:hypothetical protein
MASVLVVFTNPKATNASSGLAPRIFFEFLENYQEKYKYNIL